MKAALIGLPEVGKTTLFNALTRQNAATHAYGARENEVHVGVIPVPDERFEVAVRLCQPKKQMPATIEVSDGAARIEKTEAHTQRFGTDFFVGIRNSDALVLVVQAFSADTESIVTEPLSPIQQVTLVTEELLIADLTIVENRIARLLKNQSAKHLPAAEAAELSTLQLVRKYLEALQPIRTMDLSAEEWRSVKSMAFVTQKPLILVANLSEDEIGKPDSDPISEMQHYASSNHLELIKLCAKIDMEVAQMDPMEEMEFLEAMGIKTPARDQLIQAIYRALGYISFFTVGSDEVRAWTLRRGENALAAAGRIHSDIARGFIRAEVMPFQAFRQAGGWEEAKAAGAMRLEGKEYIVQDGDIVHIRFKV
ncbi:MAG: redox-regulated ATPase YchF [Armatimonadetes bacterium]|nr:redox-regulated ATPase YchF [Armatimonadota bacterium]